MPHLKPKKIHGHVYWYIVQSRRVGGRIKTVQLAYLGRIEDILRHYQQPDRSPDRLKSYSHGGVAVLLSLADRLGIAELFDRHVRPPRPSRPIRRLLSVGQTLLLGSIGRTLHPTSKRGWAGWARTTTLPFLWPFKTEQITSEFFWDQMDRLPAEALPAIQAEMVCRVRDAFGLRIETLYYDVTNFFSFIDSANRHCDLPQRGKNKQKRNDLRQYQLGLVASQDGWIPLASMLFRGNHNDVTTFPRGLDSVGQELRRIGVPLEGVTLVCDKGNLSAANWRELDACGLAYVASLVPSRYPQWSQRDLQDFAVHEIPEVGTVRCLRGQAQLAGRQRTLVVLDSPTLRDGQLRGLSQQLQPVRRTLNAVAQSLQQAKRRRKKELIERQIQRCLAPAAVRRIVRCDLQPRQDQEGYWDLDWQIDPQGYEHLRNQVFGRRILVSSRDEWTNEQIILAYWGQSQAEHVFRHLKDADFLALRPQFHWTDQKIAVHAFCCVTGYLLAALMRRHARQIGYTEGMDRLLEMLTAVRIVLRTEHRDKAGRPRLRWQLEDNDPPAVRLYESLVSPRHTLGPTPAND